MADFELRVNSRAFANRGVELGFDENRYGVLLDELVRNLPSEDETPIINVNPAPVWGMSSTRIALAGMGRNEEIYPSGHYLPATRTISLKVGEDDQVANRLLLNNTRQWAGDLNGELAEAEETDYQRRFVRRSITGGPIATGAIAGFEIGDGSGALIGGVAGLVVGSIAGIIDGRKRPYWKAVREFAQDPEVLAEYGRIISYKAV